jgi:hypothetical protein
MATKLPCDGAAESWAFATLLLVSPVLAIELMVHHDADWLTYAVAVITLALLGRHCRRHHRDEPTPVPSQELIP